MRALKKTYSTPLRPWDKERIGKEKEISKDYGLRRKREIWRAEAILRKYRRFAKSLEASRDPEQEKILLGKLERIGLIKSGATIDDILALTVENILDRRLQTIVFKKGFANTTKQARQFIVHGHIALNGRRIRWPSTLVEKIDESTIEYYTDKVKLEKVKKAKEVIKEEKEKQKQSVKIAAKEKSKKKPAEKKAVEVKEEKKNE